MTKITTMSIPSHDGKTAIWFAVQDGQTVSPGLPSREEVKKWIAARRLGDANLESYLEATAPGSVAAVRALLADGLGGYILEELIRRSRRPR